MTVLDGLDVCAALEWHGLTCVQLSNAWRVLPWTAWMVAFGYLYLLRCLSFSPLHGLHGAQRLLEAGWNRGCRLFEQMSGFDMCCQG
jgi:hypothetical protein